MSLDVVPPTAPLPAVEPAQAAEVAEPAYRIDGVHADAQAFYAVACDPRRHVVVEACAGAGKTWMLVSRMLRALLDGAKPQEILAITFTRKAAGEMRTRLAHWLREFAAADDARCAAELRLRGLGAAEAARLAPAMRALHEQVLAGGRMVEVRTFHAWFTQLLQAAPLDLLASFGLQPAMSLVEDLDDLRTPLRRRFNAALLADAALQADYRALVARHGRHTVADWLETAWQRRTEIALADAAGAADEAVAPAALGFPECAGLSHPALPIRSAAFVAHAQEVVAELRGKATVPRERAALAIEAAINATIATPPERASDDDAAISDLEALRAAVFTAAGTPRKLLDTPAWRQLADMLDRIAAACAQHQARLEHLRMLRLARCLLREYAALKRERGLVDMEDLERFAHALLADAALSGLVQQRLDARIRHLLIDEFQDTSPLQWQALHAWLSGYAGAGGGAAAAPVVFIVGDPKQSIYRFRRAEPKLFAAAREFIVEGLGGRVLECDHTRRNAPAVIAAVNEVFGALLAEGRFDGWRAHSTGVAAGDAAIAAAAAGAAAGLLQQLPSAERPPRRGSGDDNGDDEDGDANGAAAEPPRWRDSLREPRIEAQQRLREFEAAQVALAVRQLLREGVAPGDIFVLARTRDTLALAAHALQALHLPAVAPESALLGELPEVRDLLALLDVLVSPGHSLALAQVLKSPLLGAGDDDLVALADAADALSAAERLWREAARWWRALLASAWPTRPALARARALLPAWARAARRLPPHDLLDRIVGEGELLERIAAAVQPERRAAALAAVAALLQAALELDGGRRATPYRFVRALKRRALKMRAGAVADAVQLLTVHGAKGLEASVVLLMDCDPQPRQPDRATLLVDWPADAERPTRLAFIASHARCPPSLQPLLRVEQEARAREECNALYVAMTRARARLVVSRTPPSRSLPQQSPWQRIAPLAAAWQPDAAAAHACALETSGAPDGAPDGAPRAIPGADPATAAAPHTAGGDPAITMTARVPALPYRRAAADPGPGDDAAQAIAIRPAPATATSAAAAAAAVAARAAASAAGSAGARAAAAVAAADPQRRLGQALHRTLEWVAASTLRGADSATLHGAGAAARPSIDRLTALAQAAATEFGVAAAQAGEIAAIAARLLASPQCAAFFDAARLRWAGNEVAVADAGELLRIDRLVLLDDAQADAADAAPHAAATWWVLDYKLQHAPQALAANRAQLARYRRLVQALQPGERVRAAFISGAGELVELGDPDEPPASAG